MIFYDKDNINTLEYQIQKNIEELEKYKDAYQKKSELYSIFINTISDTQTYNLNIERINEKESDLKVISEKINSAINLLREIEFLNQEEKEESINCYNKEYEEIKDIKEGSRL